MLNVMRSQLRDEFEFIPFTTSRPPKKDVIDNWGYGAALKGGPWRMLRGGCATLGHLLSFPIVAVRRGVAIVQVQASDYFVFWEAAAYVLMARLLRRRTLLRLGGAFDVFYGGSSRPVRRLIRRAIAAPDMLIVQSRYWEGIVSQLGRGEGVLVLPNSVPALLTQPVARAAREAPVFLFLCGNEAGRKGAQELLEAMDLCHAAGAPARFHWLATPSALAEQLRRGRWGDWCMVDGFVERDDVLAAMRRADVLVMPSHGEGFPNSLLEAMALGLAPIVTPVGAVPEIVGASEPCALVVPPGDAPALAEAIIRLARDPGLRQSLGASARQRVVSLFTHEVVLTRLGAAYRRLLP